MAPTAASTPRRTGMAPISGPSTSIRPSRATRVAAGRLPTNEKRLHRSCSTDSRRKPVWSPTQRAKAATGVMRSARTSRHTGTTEWVAASRLNSSRVGRSTLSPSGPSGTERPEEAGALAGVARALPLLLDHEQQHVAVAVVVGLAHPLAVARGIALGPPLLPAAAPEHGPAGLERLSERRLVHPGHHQDLAGPGLLYHGRDEPVGVVGELGQLGRGRHDR